MPTGYTDMIDNKPEMTTEQWIMTGLARAFGICVTLRDDELNLTEEQIEKRLEKDSQSDVNYNKKELEEAKIEAKVISKRTDEEWQALYVENEKRKLKENEESIAEHKLIKTRHLQVQKELETILNSKIHTITKDIVNFGVEQLTLVKDECEPYIQEPETLQKFITETKRSNAWNLKYHTEELSKATKRANQRLKLYQQLKHDVSTLLTSCAQKGENKQ